MVEKEKGEWVGKWVSGWEGGGGLPGLGATPVIFSLAMGGGRLGGGLSHTTMQLGQGNKKLTGELILGVPGA